MVDEIGEYLFPDANEQSRDQSLEEVFDRVEGERRRFLGTHLSPDDLVEFSIEVCKSESVTLQTKYSSAPSPVLLLELCLKLAEPGDEVIVKHRYASGDGCEFRSNWPFGMDWSVIATNPMAERLREEVTAVSHSQSRQLRRAGLLVAATGAGVGAIRAVRRLSRR